MGKAYQGMSGTQEEIVNRSVEIYADHLPPKQQPTAKAKGATEDVHYAFGRVADNSAGPDMWRPRELRCLGPIYCGWIAEIINMAEDGLGWPEDLECATIAYISKEPTPNVRDMLKYRVITIPPPPIDLQSTGQNEVPTHGRLGGTVGGRGTTLLEKGEMSSRGLVESQPRGREGQSGTS